MLVIRQDLAYDHGVISQSIRKGEGYQKYATCDVPVERDDMSISPPLLQAARYRVEII